MSGKAKGAPAKGAPAKGASAKGAQAGKIANKAPCPWLCELIPKNVPPPGPAQAVLHPRKDVFILKVAKVGATGDRRCKMELELVTPKHPEKKPPGRIDTRETQCDPVPPPCTCCRPRKAKPNKNQGK
ncbi:hypothetical protein PYW08_000278 [Mythimna loreyi]|uniref:Uncharacterized protein n=1 Tax=Mythimna loreyi TaxID=667449 RepID=A0ACC2RC10_9NEOP|nr:hypothetical protein PYW08_000278 [Mythimna loreyi]